MDTIPEVLTFLTIYCHTATGPAMLAVPWGHMMAPSVPHPAPEHALGKGKGDMQYMKAATQVLMA